MSETYGDIMPEPELLNGVGITDSIKDPAPCKDCREGAFDKLREEIIDRLAEVGFLATDISLEEIATSVQGGEWTGVGIDYEPATMRFTVQAQHACGERYGCSINEEVVDERRRELEQDEAPFLRPVTSRERTWLGEIVQMHQDIYGGELEQIDEGFEIDADAIVEEIEQEIEVGPVEDSEANKPDEDETMSKDTKDIHRHKAKVHGDYRPTNDESTEIIEADSSDDDDPEQSTGSQGEPHEAAEPSAEGSAHGIDDPVEERCHCGADLLFVGQKVVCADSEEVIREKEKRTE